MFRLPKALRSRTIHSNESEMAVVAGEVTAKATLSGAANPWDLAVIAAVIVAAISWAVLVFPRRDLAAPS